MKKYGYAVKSVQDLLLLERARHVYINADRRSNPMDMGFAERFMEDVAYGNPTAPFVIHNYIDDCNLCKYRVLDGRNRFSLLSMISRGSSVYKDFATKVGLLDEKGKSTKTLLSYEIPILFLYGEFENVVETLKRYGLDGFEDAA